MLVFQTSAFVWPSQCRRPLLGFVCFFLGFSPSSPGQLLLCGCWYNCPVPKRTNRSGRPAPRHRAVVVFQASAFACGPRSVGGPSSDSYAFLGRFTEFAGPAFAVWLLVHPSLAKTYEAKRPADSPAPCFVLVIQTPVSVLALQRGEHLL